MFALNPRPTFRPLHLIVGVGGQQYNTTIKLIIMDAVRPAVIYIYINIGYCSLVTKNHLMHVCICIAGFSPSGSPLTRKGFSPSMAMTVSGLVYSPVAISDTSARAGGQ